MSTITGPLLLLVAFFCLKKTHTGVCTQAESTRHCFLREKGYIVTVDSISIFPNSMVFKCSSFFSNEKNSLSLSVPGPLVTNHQPLLTRPNNALSIDTLSLSVLLPIISVGTSTNDEQCRNHDRQSNNSQTTQRIRSSTLPCVNNATPSTSRDQHRLKCTSVLSVFSFRQSNLTAKLTHRLSNPLVTHRP